MTVLKLSSFGFSTRVFYSDCSFSVSFARTLSWDPWGSVLNSSLLLYNFSVGNLIYFYGLRYYL